MNLHFFKWWICITNEIALLTFLLINTNSWTQVSSNCVYKIFVRVYHFSIGQRYAHLNKKKLACLINSTILNSINAKLIWSHNYVSLSGRYWTLESINNVNLGNYTKCKKSENEKSKADHLKWQIFLPKWSLIFIFLGSSLLFI